MKDNKCTGSPYMWTTTTTTTTKITLQSFLRPPSLPTWRSSSFLIGLKVKSTFCIKKKQKTKQKQNKKTKDNNNNKQKTNKQKNSYTVGYTALRFLTQVRPHLSRKVTCVKSLLQSLIITYQVRQYMYWLWVKHVWQFFLLISGSIALWRH